eukprot:5385810-Ditylum_brightwellii.AAC.1
MENTYLLEAQNREYYLWKAEQTTAAIFPCLLCKLCHTVPLVSPTCVDKISPPTTRAKYVFANAQLMGLGQKGPGPSSLVMPVDCALFSRMPLQL